MRLYVAGLYVPESQEGLKQIFTTPRDAAPAVGPRISRRVETNNSSVELPFVMIEYSRISRRVETRTSTERSSVPHTLDLSARISRRVETNSLNGTATCRGSSLSRISRRVETIEVLYIIVFVTIYKPESQEGLKLHGLRQGALSHPYTRPESQEGLKLIDGEGSGDHKIRCGQNLKKG